MFVDGVVAEASLAVGALLLTAGGLALYVGRNQRQRAARVADTPRTSVDEVTSGRARVRGAVAPATPDGTFRSPVRDADCVLAAWEIEEKPKTGKTRSWERTAWGVRSVPFVVEDDTGRIRVDPGTETVGNLTDDVVTPERTVASNGVAVEGLVCEFDAFDVAVETDYGEDPPRHLRQFLETTDGVAIDPMLRTVEESTRRYSEAVLAPDDAVSVLGQAVARSGDGGGSASRGADGGTAVSSATDLVVGPSPETTYLSTRRLDTLPDGGGNFLAGALLVAAGLGLVGAALFVV